VGGGGLTELPPWIFEASAAASVSAAAAAPCAPPSGSSSPSPPEPSHVVNRPVPLPAPLLPALAFRLLAAGCPAAAAAAAAAATTSSLLLFSSRIDSIRMRLLLGTENTGSGREALEVVVMEEGAVSGRISFTIFVSKN
jgi:hypothetical protein